MKYVAALLFLTCGINAFSQNWKPVQSGDTYMYYLQGHGFDSTTICVVPDTMYALGADSVVVLNRSLVRLVANTFTWQHGFLGRRIIYRSGGNFVCQGTESLLIIPNQPLLVQWLADTMNNTLATITSRSVMTVLGNTDSIETISFSNGDSVVLTKNFGISYYRTQGAVYQLAGIKGRNVGIQIPDFYSMIYFIQPGDIQEYYYIRWSDDWSHNPMWSYTKWTHTRDSLVSKTISGNLVTLSYLRAYVDSLSSTSAVTWGTYTFDRTFNLSVAGAWITPPNNTCGLTGLYYYNPDTLNYVQYDTNAFFGCRAVVWRDLYLNPNNYQGGDTLPFVTYIPQSVGYRNYWRVIGDSIGIIYTWSSDLGNVMYQYTQSERLTYARINGVEYGTPGPQLQVSVSETNAAPAIGLFPNPANAELHYPIERGDHFLITDVLGREYSEVRLLGPGVIDISVLPPGIYFLTFVNGSTAKFTKQ